MPDVLIRAFPTELQRVGPRNLTGRLVPYNVAADVVDMVGGKPEVYREGFRPGAFSRQSGSSEPGVTRRIRLIHSHADGLGYLGPFTALREESDGLWGDAEVLRSRANDVEDLLAAGVRELSVEFRLAGASHTQVAEDGTRWRTHAHLDAVALEPKGAYTGAEVMAFRAEMDELAAEAARLRAAEQDQMSAEQRAVEEQARAAQAAQAEAAARRAAWDELAGRLDTEKSRQQELVRTYGLMVPPHGGLPIRAY